MKVLNFLAVLLLATPLAFGGQKKKVNYVTVKAKKKVTQVTGYNVTSAVNKFTFRCLKELVKNPNANLIFSPRLTFINLSKFYAGSKGKTREEIQKVCGFPEDSTLLLKSLNYSDYLIKKSLESSQTTLVSNDSIWLDNDSKLKNQYKNLVSDYLPIEFFNEDFSNSEMLCNKINRWATIATHGKIRNLFSENAVHKNTKLLSLNTLYFKGTWEFQFKRKYTKKKNFYLKPKKRKKVAMMFQKEDFSWAENDYCKCVSLPFKNNEFSMKLILPKKTFSIVKLLEQLTCDDFNKLEKDAKVFEVKLGMPKLNLSKLIQTKNLLGKIGLKQAFTEQADFSEMSSKNIFINRMIQKVYLKVDEAGVEAAAVSTGELAFCTPLVFYANRPFLFFITHNKTKTILFAGYVVNP